MSAAGVQEKEQFAQEKDSVVQEKGERKGDCGAGEVQFGARVWGHAQQLFNSMSMKLLDMRPELLPEALVLTVQKVAFAMVDGRYHPFTNGDPPDDMESDFSEGHCEFISNLSSYTSCWSIPRRAAQKVLDHQEDPTMGR